MEVEPAQPLQFDLEGYAANYTGHAKIDRLLYVATAAAGQPLEVEALKLAATELKKTTNTALYRDVTTRLAGRAGPAHDYDAAWAISTDDAYATHIEALEAALNAARSSLAKEAIRVGHTALGDHLFERGEVAEAFRQYLRSRDYCTSPAQVVGMCLAVTRCALVMRNYLHVGTYVQKAEALPEGAADPGAMARLRAAQGAAFLAQGKYLHAARAFTSLPADLAAAAGASENGGDGDESQEGASGADAIADLLSPGDVATYGTLCALATMDRSDVAARVVKSAQFRSLLASAPPAVRDMAADFHASRYGSALAALASLRPSLALDPYIADHMDALAAAVRARALTQYARPFAALDLGSMATAFNTDPESLQSELVALIAAGEVAGRVDAAAGTLVAKKADLRGETYRAALTAAEAYLAGTKAMLLRAGMQRHDVIQRPAGGDRPERPERPDRGEGSRPGRERGEGGRRRLGGRERGERSGAAPGGWAAMLEGAGSMLE